MTRSAFTPRRRHWTLISPYIAALQCAGRADETSEQVSGPSLADESAAAGSATAHTKGKLLYSVELTPGHRLDFWEMSNHVLGTEETTVVDEAHVTASLGAEGWTLAKVYRLAVPNASETPAVILDADAARAQWLEQNGGVQPVSDRDEREPAFVAASDSPDRLSTKATACSPDYYNDNWGAQWFLDRFCTGSSKKWCKTNMISADSGWRTATWFKWSVMAADFVQGAETHATYDWLSCSGANCYVFESRAVDASVASRTVKTWTLTSGFSYTGTATGQTPCQRVHVAAVWN